MRFTRIVFWLCVWGREVELDRFFSPKAAGLVFAVLLISCLALTPFVSALTPENIKTWYWTNNTGINSVVLGDVDADGQVEIVTGGNYYDGFRYVAQLCVWNAATLNLENVKTWYWTSHTYISSIALGNVDGDGAVEIVTGGGYWAGTYDVAQLCVWNGATLDLENIKTWTSNAIIKSVALGNVDGDDAVEIVTGGYKSNGIQNAQLCVWNGATLDLENVKTWYWTSTTYIYSVTLGNVDGDGAVEIITGGTHFDGTRWVAQLCVWNGATLDLENVKTWYWTSTTYIYSVTLGNVDGDGAVEIITGGTYSDGLRSVAQLCVWNGATLELEKVKVWYWTDDTLIRSASLGDVDGDGAVEIVTGGYYWDDPLDIAQLCVWNGATLELEKVKVWYWTDDTLINSASLGDVDGDGAVEIVTGGTYSDGLRSVAQLCVWAP
jgi:large repetitive protein